MPARSLPEVDQDLGKAEISIRDIKKELGNIPSNKRNVLARLDSLELAVKPISTLQGQQTQLSKDTAAAATDIKSLNEKIKLYRWVLLGAVATVSLIKFDLQVLKIDITLWKKLERDHFVNFGKKLGRAVKDRIKKEEARLRKEQEAAQKELKEKEEKAEKELQEKIRKLPEQIDDVKKKVAEVEKSTETAALRRKLDRHYYPKSHAEGLRKGIRRAQDAADKAQRDVDSLRKGLHAAARAGKPKAPPNMSAKKDVTDLRASVNALSQALAGI